jgi:hypothetical protein
MEVFASCRFGDLSLYQVFRSLSHLKVDFGPPLLRFNVDPEAQYVPAMKFWAQGG